jgi:hypothetical protein
MTVTLWTAGVIVSLLALVIAALPMRRHDQRPRLTVGSVSGDWLTEYKAKHSRD